MGTADTEGFEAMNDANLFWVLWGIGLPILIGAGAYTAVRLHERSLKR